MLNFVHGKDDGLAMLNAAVERDLRNLEIPANWVPSKLVSSHEPSFDVCIIGAGMHGVAAAGALMLRGICNIVMIDSAPEGQEGPWTSYARMPTLRSAKELTGPCLGIPSLTFRSYYEAAYGTSAWSELYKVKNRTWQEYISWVRQRLNIPLLSQTKITAINAGPTGVALETAQGASINCRRVVLATGRLGTGGPALPPTIDPRLWPTRAAHTSEDIDFSRLRGKRVAVMGAGASAWDNAATACEAGASKVTLYCRRTKLPQVNKGRATASPGFLIGWSELPDEEKWDLFSYMAQNPSPPPHETVNRTIANPAFEIKFGEPVLSARPSDQEVLLSLPGREDKTDFLIVGTGFAIDLGKDALLGPYEARIMLWSDHFDPSRKSALGAFPYVDESFALRSKTDASAGELELSRVHLFNHASFASLGAVASDVPGSNIGAEKLANAIVKRFFKEDYKPLMKQLRAHSEPELKGTPFLTLTS